MFPSSLRDLERDTDGDGDDEPSLRPQNPVAVATLRAADLEEFVKGTCRRCPSSPQAPLRSLFVRGCTELLALDSDFDRRDSRASNSTRIGFRWSLILVGASDLDVAGNLA